jgi:hypothetical protein
MRAVQHFAAALLIAASFSPAGAQQLKSTQRLLAAANESCAVRYPDAAKAAPRAKCENENARIVQERADYPDILDAELAQIVALNEKIQTGKMTPSQASAAFARYRSQSDGEIKFRNRNGRNANSPDVATRAPAPQAYVSPPSRRPAPAQDRSRNCYMSSNSIQCDDGLSGHRSTGNSVIWSDGVVSYRTGDTVISTDGSSSVRSGSTTLYSDGTSSVTAGDTILFSDGRVCQRYAGGQIICN